MNIYLSIIMIVFFCVALMQPGYLHAQKTTVEQQKLYIGIIKNRHPYSYLDDKKNPQGILVDKLTTLCEKIDAQCSFVAGNFNKLLKDVKNLQLHALVIIDNVIEPEMHIHNMQLTPPLCVIQPVMIKRRSSNNVPQDKGREKIIGVGHNTLFHHYLQDENNKLASLRPYYTVENGIFDLVSERIDAVFTDQAIFQERVASTALASTNNPKRLITQKVDNAGFPLTSMTLAIRQQNQTLVDSFTQAIQMDGGTRHCTCLLKLKQQAPSHDHKQNCSPA